MAEPRKDDAGKNRYDLIPADALEELARVFTIGANKYGERNWEGGLPYGRVFAAMQRHAWAFWNGEETDPEDGQHHLASVAWGALVLLAYRQRGTGTDDRQRNVSGTSGPRGDNDYYPLGRVVLDARMPPDRVGVITGLGRDDDSHDQGHAEGAAEQRDDEPPGFPPT